jgi:hypothetical protein
MNVMRTGKQPCSDSTDNQSYTMDKIQYSFYKPLYTNPTCVGALMHYLQGALTYVAWR